jgi:hypothetical protein
MSRSAGPKPKISVAHGLSPSSIGSALISTPLSIKNFSKPGSTKAGSVVVKLLTVLTAAAGSCLGVCCGAGLGGAAFLSVGE